MGGREKPVQNTNKKKTRITAQKQTERQQRRCNTPFTDHRKNGIERGRWMD
jgi:hypothetical protein